MNTHTTNPERHPPGLYVLFATEMWERFSFYTMAGMLVLYMTNDRQGFDWSTEKATSVNSWYQACVYASPLIGGWIADRYLGFRRCITIGGLFFMAGHLLLAVPESIPIFYLALMCLVIGNGFFKPNVSSLVGNLYREGSHLKDKAYLIFYMGINIGAALAPIVAEFVQKAYGYHVAFAVAAGGMVASLAVFWGFGKHVQAAERRREVIGAVEKADSVAVTEDVPPLARPNRPAMDDIPEWKRIAALIVIFAVVIVFWMVFHQNSSTLTLWAHDKTDWQVTGIISNAINPICVICLSLPLAWFWTWLDRRGLEPSTPTKICMGMLLTGGSFLVLYAAALSGGYTAPVAKRVKAPEGIAPAGTVLLDLSHDTRATLGITASTVDVDPPAAAEGSPPQRKKQATPARLVVPTTGDAGAELFRIDQIDAGVPVVTPVAKVSPWWLIGGYIILTLGELMLSPMGLALVSKVAPERMRGLMMGGWFLATAIGNKLTAIGRFWDVWGHTEFFLLLASMAIGMALVLFGLLRPLKKAMPGV